MNGIRNACRHLAVTGFVVTLDAVCELAPVLLDKQPHLLTYKFSQDHLELFFNAIRRSGMHDSMQHIA